MSFRNFGDSIPPLNTSISRSYSPYSLSSNIQQQNLTVDSGSEDETLAIPVPRSRVGSFSRFEVPPPGTPFWGTSPAPRSPLLLECCCGRENCPNLTTFIRNSRSMEEELRLAAEVGQALLHKHEVYQREMEEFQEALEHQCARAEQEVQELKDLIREMQQDQRTMKIEREDNQREKAEILELVRELEQTQFSLERQLDDAQRQKSLVERKNDTLTTALEASDARVRDLVKELEKRDHEIKLLMADNIKGERSEQREEDLRRQMEDLKQELTVARKAESAAEARVRKIKGKYDALHSSYERLKRDQNDSHRSKGKLEAVAMLRESNERLRDEFKQSSANNEANTHLITLIKELSSANHKLKSNIIEYRELLTESRNEVSTLQNRVEELETANATGYSPYPPSYATDVSCPIPFKKGLPVDEGATIEEDSPVTAVFIDESLEGTGSLTTKIPGRPIHPHMSASVLSSSFGGAASINTFNSMVVDPSLASPAGSLISNSMLSSSNPPHYHHHYHHYHHYPSEKADIVRGSVFGELEKYLMKKKPRGTRRPGQGALKKGKKRFVEIVEDGQKPEIKHPKVEENNEGIKATKKEKEKTDDSYSESEDLTYTDEFDEERVNGEEKVVVDASEVISCEASFKNAENQEQKEFDKYSSILLTKEIKDKANTSKSLSAISIKGQRPTIQRSNSISLLSAGLKDAENNIRSENSDENILSKKSDNDTKEKDVQNNFEAKESSPASAVNLSRRGGIPNKIQESGLDGKQHKPNLSSPLAASRRTKSTANSSLSVKVSQLSDSPANPKSKSIKPNIPAFKNPKFATLGPKERKQMMEAWRAGVAKEQVKTSRNQDQKEKVRQHDTETRTQMNSLDKNKMDNIKGKTRMDLSDSPVKDFVEEVLVGEANLSAAEAAALANEVEHGLSSGSRRTSTATRRTSLHIPSIMVYAPAVDDEENVGGSGNNVNHPLPPELPQHQSPYQALFNCVNNLMDRLKGTDIMTLNRNLKRQFDMLELSNISNNLIENILVDVENLRERFRWAEDLRGNEVEKSRIKQTHVDYCGSEDGNNKDLYKFSLEEFLPLTHLMQDILAEIGKLRIMVNEVQVSYVQKVEENRRKAEEEFDKSLISNKPDDNQEQKQSQQQQRDRRRNQTSDGGLGAFFISRVFGGVKEVQSPTNTSRHHSRRMSVEFSHDRDISIGSIDTFAEETYYTEQNMDSFSSHSAPNTLRVRKRRESMESVGTIFKRGVVSFFGRDIGNNNNNNDNDNKSYNHNNYQNNQQQYHNNNSMNIRNTFYDTKDEVEVEKFKNYMENDNGKRNLEDNLTLLGRNNNEFVQKRQQKRFNNSRNNNNNASHDQSNYNSNDDSRINRSTPTTIRSSSNTIQYIGGSPRSSPISLSQPPSATPTSKLITTPKQIRTSASNSDLEKRLRQHLVTASTKTTTTTATSTNSSILQQGDSGRFFKSDHPRLKISGQDLGSDIDDDDDVDVDVEDYNTNEWKVTNLFDRFFGK
ncbi:hypothetical protein G9A89_017671 [Geosiphon pyriformis]|nr:hypothetical protein G9A89_017671 [Geosiphon pyriformis]